MSRIALAAIALLLAAALAASPSEEAPFELNGDAARAQPVYTKFCAPCHGAEGKGDGPMGTYLDPPPRDMTDAAYMKTRSDEQLYLAIKLGGAEVGLSDKMAPWQELIPDQDMRDLAAFVRTFSEGGELAPGD